MNYVLIMNLVGPVSILICLAIIFIATLNSSKLNFSRTFYLLITTLLGLLIWQLFNHIDFYPIILLHSLIVVLYLVVNNAMQQVQTKYSGNPQLITQAKEQERSRIYANLHDDVGAKLLELIYTAENDKTKALAKDVLSNIRQAVASTVNIQCNVQQLIQEIESETKLRLSTSTMDLSTQFKIANKKQNLAANIPSVISRICREVTSNIIKHSQANQVQLLVISDAKYLNISLIDDGIGFKLNKNGKGLKTIQKRAQSINAQVEWNPNTPQGTAFNFTYTHGN